MDSDDVRQMLSGDYDGAPDDELPAIMFAQHYADTGGNPDPEAWAAIPTVIREGFWAACQL